MTRSPADLFPLWTLADDCIVTTRGMLWGGAEIFGVDPTTMTESEWQLFSAVLHNELPKVSDGLQLQIVSEVQKLGEREFCTSESVGDETLRYQKQRRQEFLGKKGMTRKRVYLFWSPLAAPTGAFRAVSLADHKRGVEAIESSLAELRSIFRPAGIELGRLDAAALWSLFARWMVPGDAPRVGPSLDEIKTQVPREDVPAVSPRESLFVGSFSATDDFVRHGDSYVKVLACKRLPSETTANLLGLLYQLDFDCRIVLNLHFPPRSASTGVFDRQRKFAVGNAAPARLGGAEDVQAQHGAGEMMQAAYDLAQGARLVRIGLQAVVAASSLRELRSRARTMRDALAAVDFLMFEESCAHDREFFKTLPGMSEAFDRWRMVTSHVAADLLPVGRHPLGDRNPALFFQNAISGEPFGYTLRERVRANDNFLILGASGAGKSVLINMLLAHEILPDRVIAIDYAGPTKSSFRTACEVFGGRYISISGEGQKINPWERKTSAYDRGSLRPEVVRFLTHVCNILFYNTEGSKDDALFEALIQKGIVETYERHEGDAAPTFSSFLEALRGLQGNPDIDETRLRRLVELVQKLLNGPAAPLLNAQTEIDGAGQFVTYDLFGLHGYDDRTKAAVAAIVVNYVRQIAFDGKPERRKYVALEEVTNLLGLGLKQTVEELATTARAHNVAVGFITQEYAQYRRSGLAGAINLNTTTKFLMSHKSATNAMDPIIEDMALNEKEATLFRSLQAVKGQYSELLVKTQCWSPEGGRDVTAKLRFELSPFDYQVVTSDARDRALQLRVERMLAERFPGEKISRAVVLDHLAHRGAAE